MKEVELHFDRPPTNFVDVLRKNVDGQPDLTAFHFLANDRSGRSNVSAEQILTYRQVDECARAIAVQLQERKLRGERATADLRRGAFVCYLFSRLPLCRGAGRSDLSAARRATARSPRHDRR